MNKKTQKGFTLIELILSISIIGFLSAMTVPTLLAGKDKVMNNASWIQQCHKLTIENLPNQVNCEDLLGKSPNKQFTY